MAEADHIGFDFLKSNNFRVIRVDGAWGGVGPHGDIQMALYNERQPIPRRVEFKLLEGGRLGEEISRDARAGIVREVEIEALMTVQTAIALRDWLTEKIEQVQGTA